MARNYTAQTLNLATSKSLTQYDVVAVSAMEAVGVAPAINLHNQISGRPPHLSATHDCYYDSVMGEVLVLCMHACMLALILLYYDHVTTELPQARYDPQRLAACFFLV